MPSIRSSSVYPRRQRVPAAVSGLLLVFLTATANADGPVQTGPSGSGDVSLAAGVPEHTLAQLDTAGLMGQTPAVLLIEGRIDGGDADHVVMDLAALQSLQPYRISTSTVVTDGVLDFDGVLMRDLFDHVGARGKRVTATALNGYQVEIPMRDFQDFDVLLAWAVDGKPLRADDKGPFWIIYPRDQHDVLQDIRYDYRWVWQLSSLRVH